MLVLRSSWSLSMLASMRWAWLTANQIKSSVTIKVCSCTIYTTKTTSFPCTVDAISKLGSSVNTMHILNFMTPSSAHNRTKKNNRKQRIVFIKHFLEQIVVLVMMVVGVQIVRTLLEKFNCCQKVALYLWFK